MRKLFKTLAQNIFLPLVYWIFKFRPIQDGLVIMADAHCTKRPVRMDTMYEELHRRGYLIKEIYTDYQKMSYPGVLKASLQFMRWYASANYVIISDNFLPAASCNKKKGTFVIQLWHGCGAFKKFGYDTSDDIPESHKGNVFKNYDLVTVSGEASVGPFTSAMRQTPGICQPIGVSATDCYFDKTYLERCRRNFYTKHPKANGKKVLLWAPTFRGKASDPYLVGEEAFEKAAALLADEWYVLIKKHPHMEQKGHSSSTDIPTEELLPVADLLITDYSSIIFNFLIFQKPIVFFSPDLDTYLNERGFYMNYKHLPGKIVKDEAALIEAIQNIPAWFDKEQLHEFYLKYMSGCDGNAAKRIVDIMDTKKYSNAKS